MIVVFVLLLSFDAWCYRARQHGRAKWGEEYYENLTGGVHQEPGNSRTQRLQGIKEENKIIHSSYYTHCPFFLKDTSCFHLRFRFNPDIRVERPCLLKLAVEYTITDSSANWRALVWPQDRRAELQQVFRAQEQLSSPCPGVWHQGLLCELQLLPIRVSR